MSSINNSTIDSTSIRIISTNKSIEKYNETILSLSEYAIKLADAYVKQVHCNIQYELYTEKVLEVMDTKNLRLHMLTAYEKTLAIASTFKIQDEMDNNIKKYKEENIVFDKLFYDTLNAKQIAIDNKKYADDNVKECAKQLNQEVLSMAGYKLEIPA